MGRKTIVLVAVLTLLAAATVFVSPSTDLPNGIVKTRPHQNLAMMFMACICMALCSAMLMRVGAVAQQEAHPSRRKSGLIALTCCRLC